VTAKRDRIAEFLDAWRAEHPGEPFIPELERMSSNFAAELRRTRLREIRSWVAECEGKKAALEKEFSHLMRLYQPYSNRREDCEYQLCEVFIPHLKLEIERRARGGGQPNENANGVELGKFTHSEDYRSVTLSGKDYELTSKQAQIIGILDRASQDEKPDVAIHNILEQLGTPNSRWQDTFKSNSEAKKALIRSGKRRGTLRLNL
jgi:hypothetical protein